MAANSSKKEEEIRFKKDIVSKVAARIKELRKSQGYTNAEKFSNQHNIARSQYALYEQGKDLQISSLARVIKHLDITLAEFFSQGFDD